MLRRKLTSSLIISSCTFLIFTANAYAADNGFYLGGQLGWGDIHDGGLSGVDMRNILVDVLGPDDITAFSPLDTSDDSDSGLAGRLFFGYQFDCHWATEFGWTKFKNMNTSAEATAIDLAGVPITASASGTIKTDAIDWVVKGTQPLQYGLSVWGKLGIAYLYERAEVSGSITDGVNTFTGSDTKHEGRVYPTFGIGVAYDITRQWVTDISWMRIQEVSNNDVSSTDLFSLGLSYHIS